MGITKRTGDNGTTTIFSGDTIRKDHVILTAWGALEELECRLGLAKLHVRRFYATIGRFQGSLVPIAHEISSYGRIKYDDIDKETHFLDVLVEEYSRDIGVELDEHRVPGKSIPSAELHLARVICKKAERVIVGLQDVYDVNRKFFKYFNRLSDVLYLMAVIAEDTDIIDVDEKEWSV